MMSKVMLKKFELYDKLFVVMVMGYLGRCVVQLVVCVVVVMFVVIVVVVVLVKFYDCMVFVDVYFMDCVQEIVLVRSVVLVFIFKDVIVLVMICMGYEIVVIGSNGFVCWVVCGFVGVMDWFECWNFKICVVGCDNLQVVCIVIEIVKFCIVMIFIGYFDVEVVVCIQVVLCSKKILLLVVGVMCYMMFKLFYLFDEGEYDMVYVMFYVLFKDGVDWGVNVIGLLVFGGNYWFYLFDYYVEVVVLFLLLVLLVGVGNWFDGMLMVMLGMQ